MRKCHCAEGTSSRSPQRRSMGVCNLGVGQLGVPRAARARRGHGDLEKVGRRSAGLLPTRTERRGMNRSPRLATDEDEGLGIIFGTA